MGISSNLTASLDFMLGNLKIMIFFKLGDKDITSKFLLFETLSVNLLPSSNLPSLRTRINLNVRESPAKKRSIMKKMIAILVLLITFFFCFIELKSFSPAENRTVSHVRIESDSTNNTDLPAILRKALQAGKSNAKIWRASFFR